MTTEKNQKEMTPKNLNDLGNGLDVAGKVVHFLYYYELVEKNYQKENFIGLSQKSEESMKNVDKLAKITGIHPNLTRELILLHEKSEKIIDVRENLDLCQHEQTMQIGEILDMCPCCVEKLNL